MSQDSRANSAGFFLAGAVVGGAIGAVVALLVAPQSGEETRNLIRKKAKEAGKNFEEMKKDLEPKLRKAKKDITGQLSK